MSVSRTTRLVGVLAGAATGVVVLAGVASAHVTVQPPSAPAGGDATLSFQVPNERDSASTVGFDVELPADTPIASVSVQPKPGWTYQVTHAKPATPVASDEGEVTEVVTRITWKTEGGGPGIRPGEFDTFPISAGPLPEHAESLAFKAVQTYSDGTVVRWIDVAAPGAAEPDHPAPVLRLTAAPGGEKPAPAAGTTGAAAASDNSDGTARAVGVAGLAVGALGLGVGGLALAAARRRPSAN
jgi:uncharacterized protein